MTSRSSPAAFNADMLGDVLAASHDSAKTVLQGARGLRDYLDNIDKLPPDSLTAIVDQAICLLENFYAHLPFKRAMHAIDPLQRLRLLRRRLPEIQAEIEVHAELTDIFTSLRDLHTNYLLPDYFGQMIAVLPFRVRYYYSPDGRPHYVVSEVLAGVKDPDFQPGVELTYWNGIPIDRAVELAAAYHAGSNVAARHARGVDGLTFRSLRLSAPPDEEWVVAGYRDPAAAPGTPDHEVTVEWVVANLPAQTPASAAAGMGDAMGIDLEGDIRRRVFAHLYAPAVIEAGKKIATARSTSAAATPEDSDAAALATVQGLESIMPEVFTAQLVLQPSGTNYGYLRIWTFDVDDAGAFVREAQRLVGLLPQEGLVIDVQGNGGGLIYAGEQLLQLFTPKRIEPTRAQFVVSPLTLELAKVAQFSDWKSSLERAAATGATFSAAFPITDPASCNAIGQCYHGPVVLITDARCYSTTDMFAVGFRDHEIGVVLGVDPNLGAGGANVWTTDTIRAFLPPGSTPPSLAPLLSGTNMRVAIRRTLRVGREAGTEIEDLGITPDEVHRPTYDDVMHGDRDLLARASAILAARPVYRLEATVPAAGLGAPLSIATLLATRVDVYVNSRPVTSLTVVADACQAVVDVQSGDKIDLQAFDASGQLVAARRLTVV